LTFLIMSSNLTKNDLDSIIKTPIVNNYSFHRLSIN
jgi:hypothetical protein